MGSGSVQMREDGEDPVIREWGAAMERRAGEVMQVTLVPEGW